MSAIDITGEAVVFDLDGTLLDTLEDLAWSVNRVLAALGCPEHPIGAYRQFVGDGAPMLIRRALPADRVDELADEALERFRRDYSEHMNDHTRPYPGIPELLDELSGRSVPMAIISNKPQAMIGPICEALLGCWSFALLAGQGGDYPKKPDPASSLAAARAFGLAPERCFFVGDSDVDMRTARAAAMQPLGAGWGFRGAAELRAAGALLILDEPADLLRGIG